MENNMTKDQICAAIRAHINQRSGIDFRNYGDRSSFMSDYRRILRDGKDARELLNFVEGRDSITAQDLLDASQRAFSGRLTIGENGADYCTGQYFPTEYRSAACAVLASAIWRYWADDANDARKLAKGHFGRGLASRWFR